MSTTYEDDEENINKPLHIEFAELLEGDVGECIKDCLQKGISPSIFCDMIFYNGGEYIQGKFDFIVSNKFLSKGLFNFLKILINTHTPYLNSYLGHFCDSEPKHHDNYQSLRTDNFRHKLRYRNL